MPASAYLHTYSAQNLHMLLSNIQRQRRFRSATCVRCVRNASTCAYFCFCHLDLSNIEYQHSLRRVTCIRCVRCTSICACFSGLSLVPLHLRRVTCIRCVGSAVQAVHTRRNLVCLASDSAAGGKMAAQNIGVCLHFCTCADVAKSFCMQFQDVAHTDLGRATDT